MPSPGFSVAKPSRFTRWASMNRTRPIGRFTSASAIEGTPRLEPDGRSRGREGVVLGPARPADAQCTGHASVVPQRDTAAEGDEPPTGGGVVAGEVTAGSHLLAQVEGGDAVPGRGVGLVDGDAGPGELGAVHPPECQEVTATVNGGRGHQAPLRRGRVTCRADHAFGEVEVHHPEHHGGLTSAFACARSRLWMPPYAATPGRYLLATFAVIV